MKKIGTDRESGTASPTFTLKIPRSGKLITNTTTVGGKTSLFVPKRHLLAAAEFKASKNISKQVQITDDINGVLKAVFTHGDVAERFGDNGLENDPTKQQIIVYTAVVCQGHVLWYQRASEKSELKEKKVLETRLQGKYSIGFGGHKTSADIQFSRKELVFLKQLLPAVCNEIGTILGVNRGFFAEVEEELGLTRESVKEVKLLGAFMDNRFEDPQDEIQVEWVHTGIATILEVDESQVDRLTLRKSEITKAWWVPQQSLRKEYEKLRKDWLSGRGSKVERWTEIMIKEFLQ